MDAVQRCAWCGVDPLYQHYHDTVWGRPERDSRELFKKLCLDGQQAGLSWITILRKEANYDAAFFAFDPLRVAAMTDAEAAAQMHNAGIVRNRLKIRSIINNAAAYLAIEQGGTDFSTYIWSFVGGQTVTNAWLTQAEVPTETAQSRAMSKALKKSGFSFVGPTICYAFMQAVGMVNDHQPSCHCYQSLTKLAR